jgi:hypothetical protein
LEVVVERIREINSMALSNSTLAAQASSAARGRLIRNHQEEYNSILAVERENRGLPAASYSDPVTKLQQKLEKLQAQQAEVQKELELLSTAQ